MTSAHMRTVRHMTNVRKQFIRWAFPLGSLLLIVALLLHSTHLDNVIGALKVIQPLYLFIAFMLIVAYWLAEAMILYRLTKDSESKITFFKALKITLAGQFFNGVTPFASGGQPAQLYMMHREEIPVARGASILTRKFIIYQSVLVLYSFLVVLFESSYFVSEIPKFAYMGLIGFSLNVIVIVMLLMIAYHYKFTRGLALRVVRFFRRHIKRPKARVRLRRVMVHLRDFHRHMELETKRSPWALLGIMTLFQLTFFFSIPIAIGYGFHLNAISMFHMIGAAAFVSMVTSFIPLPGAAFGAEGSFYLFYQLFFPKNLVLTALIIWRFLTFYLPLIIGGLVVLFETRSQKKKVFQE